MQLESSKAPVQEVVAKRARDRAKRERFPRNLAFVEEPHFEAFGPWAEIEIEKTRTKHHIHLVDLRQADHRVELAHRDARVRFLERLAQRAARQRLPILEKSRWQRPQAVPRLDRTTAKQHALAPLGQASDDDLRVLVVDRTALRANVARKRVAVGNAALDAGRSADAAEVHRTMRVIAPSRRITGAGNCRGSSEARRSIRARRRALRAGPPSPRPSRVRASTGVRAPSTSIRRDCGNGTSLRARA